MIRGHQHSHRVPFARSRSASPVVFESILEGAERMRDHTNT